MSVAAVVRVLIFVVILAVAKLVIQLCLQAIFHELGNGFLEQALDILHAAYVRHIQQFSDFFPTCIFFRGAIISGHNNYLQCGASILHLYTTLEVYTKFGMVSALPTGLIQL